MTTSTEPRVRSLHAPTDTELDAVYRLGRDAWGDGLSESDYLAACRDSVKYRRGTWYVATDADRVVSALIVYADGFGLAAGCHGIGSVATARDVRGRGHASRLLDHVLRELGRRGSRGVFLFRDTDTGLYARHGFEAVEPGEGSSCLWRAFEHGSPAPPAPAYF